MANPTITLTQARLKELLHYDPDTGVFTWKSFRRGKAKAGSVAGNKNQTGYIHIYVDNRPYKAHRLAWLYVYGSFPEGFIDHINGVRDDNSIRNLREASNRENVCNAKSARKDSKTGIMGVSMRGEKFVSEIRNKGARHFLGYFDSAEDAHQAYLAAKRRLHPTFTL